MTPLKYQFELPKEENAFNVFPSELENDSLVFFHGTADGNRRSIVTNGFRIIGDLPSVSFARNSGLALNYACAKRTAESPDGCILAVRFDSVEKPEIKSEEFGIHVYKFDPQPTIVGYCVIPAKFAFV